MTAWHDWIPVAVRELRASLAKKGNTAAAVKAAEKKLKLSFPKRYREFISKWDGGELRLKFLPLAEVVKDAKGRRGDESDPLGELPEHLVPIAEEPHGIEVYCVSRAKKPDQRIFMFDPEQPETLRSFPDFEALVLDRVSGSGFDPGPDGEYLKAIVAAHGVDWADDEPLAKWLPFEKCKAVPDAPKPLKQPVIKLENWKPGVMGIPSKGEKGFPSVTGHLAREIVATVAPMEKAMKRWTINIGKGWPDEGTTRELTRDELGILAKQLATFVKQRGYEKDKHWAPMAAALTKASTS